MDLCNFIIEYFCGKKTNIDSENNFEFKMSPTPTIIINKSKGLDDLGGTGYMNASLQCLSNTPQFKNYFLEKYNINTDNILANEFHELILNLWRKNMQERSYSPHSFKQTLGSLNPLFDGIQANDAKDLINFLLENLHKELNVIINNNNTITSQIQDQTNEELTLKLFSEEFKQKYNSLISNLFYGLSESEYLCQGCGIIKYTFQSYSMLEFPLQQVNQYFYSIGKKPLLSPNNKNPDVNLDECFEFNEKANAMTGDNQIYCNKCNRTCNVVHSTKLYTAPNYLIINLNRGKDVKYECNVDFPEQLDLTKYLKFTNKNTNFELYAVISFLNGDFVAYIKNDEDKSWYLYNNSVVTQCSKHNQYKDGIPYILFYQVLNGKKKSKFLG